MKFSTKYNIHGLRRVILGIIVLIFLLFTTFFVNSLAGNISVIKNYEKVSSTVVSSSTSDTPSWQTWSMYTRYITVSFTYDDTEYSDVVILGGSYSVKVGGNMEIYINPDDPYDAYSNQFWYKSVGIFTIMLAILAIFIVYLRLPVRQKKREEELSKNLSENGIIYHCVIEKTYKKNYIKNTLKKEYQLECSCKKDDLKLWFKSECDERIIEYKEGAYIDVLADKDDYRKYRVLIDTYSENN